MGACMIDMQRLRKGDRRNVARAITAVENDPAGCGELLRTVIRHAGESSIFGITGSAGAGKSSLINEIAIKLADRGLRPAVLAVDPTSHVTGGAILGDRVRMTRSTDSGVYIRSIASRGARGAVSASLRNGIRILEYAGYDIILVESVGAGQTEVDIASIVDVTTVVFNPHTGDSIQAIKAGITEIGDICVINKADLPGSAALYDAVRDYIGDGQDGPSVLLVSAKDGEGIDELADALLSATTKAAPQKLQRRSASLQDEIEDIILNNLRGRLDMAMKQEEAHHILQSVLKGETDPHAAAHAIQSMTEW